uniref:zonadhesin-like n=1 Tax=Pristiophorus japonicus TaxID=55135 RepID=UPI00398EA458
MVFQDDILIMGRDTEEPLHNLRLKKAKCGFLVPEGLVAQFVDDTKICASAGTVEEAGLIQADLNVLGDWAQDWKMTYNLDECRVMHVGRANAQHSYTLQGKALKMVEIWAFCDADVIATRSDPLLPREVAPFYRLAPDNDSFSSRGFSRGSAAGALFTGPSVRPCRRNVRSGPDVKHASRLPCRASARKKRHCHLGWPPGERELKAPVSRPSPLLDCSAEDPVKDYVTRCDFNDDADPFCKWVQPVGNDDGDWSRVKGSAQTKPPADQPAPWDRQEAGRSTGYYIHQEASNLAPRQFIRLESRPLNVSGDVCVEFSYHMYGGFDDGATLRVLVGDGTRETPLWHRTAPQSHAWLSGAVTIPVPTHSTIRVIFMAIRGQSHDMNIALDNVAITTGPCFSCIHGCDFDQYSDLCGWTTDTNVGDEHESGWIQGIGNAVDFTKPGLGSYMMLESQNIKPGQRFHLKSPSINLSQCLSLTFYYYLYGNAKTMAINVLAERQGGSIRSQLWSIMGDHGPKWNKVEVVHCGTWPIRFVIEGVQGEIPASDIAVDKVCIVACSEHEHRHPADRNPHPNRNNRNRPTRNHPPYVSGYNWVHSARLDHSLAHSDNSWVDRKVMKRKVRETNRTARRGVDRSRSPAGATGPEYPRILCHPSFLRRWGSSPVFARVYTGSPPPPVKLQRRGGSTSRPPECSDNEPKKDYITRCDFNDNLEPYCNWTQICATDSGDWIRTNGETPTAHTGPSRDHPAPWGKEQKNGYYIYEEASNLAPRQFIRLESRPLNVSGDVCVEFSYHMYGGFDDGATLRVLVGDGARETPLWDRTLPQSHAWLSGAVTIPVPTHSTIRVIFETVRGLTEVGDIALDNIAVINGPCFSCIHGCDFDQYSDLCGWTTEKYVVDANDNGWIQGSGNAGDFTKPGLGSYMLLQSADNTPGHRFHLKSPSVNASQCLSLTFYYYLYGDTTTMAINVYAQRQGTLTKPLLKVTGDQEQRWREAQVVYCGASPVQFVIEGVSGNDKISELAVDKVCIVACTAATTPPNQPRAPGRSIAGRSLWGKKDPRERSNTNHRWNTTANHRRDITANHRSDIMANHRSDITANHRSDITTNHRSDITANHRSDITTNHRSDITANHRSDITANHRSNITTNHRSDITANHRSNITTNHRSDITANHRSNITTNHRSDITANHRSDITTNHRSDITANHRSNITTNHRSDITANHRSNITTNHRSDITANHRSDITTNHRSDITANHRSDITTNHRSDIMANHRSDITTNHRSDITTNHRSNITANHRSDITPTTDQTSRPTTDQTSRPTTDQTSQPTTDQTSRPTTDQTSRPTTDQTSQPTTDQTSRPTTDQTSRPTTDQTSRPTTDQTSQPTTDQTSRSDIAANHRSDITANHRSDIMANHRSDITANHRSDIMANHRSDITANHRSDIMANHRSDIAANHRSDITANHRSDITANHRSDITANHRSDIMANHRSDIMANHRSDITANHRSDIAANHRSDITANHRSDITANHRSDITTNHRSDITTNHRSDITTNHRSDITTNHRSDITTNHRSDITTNHRSNITTNHRRNISTTNHQCDHNSRSVFVDQHQHHLRQVCDIHFAHNGSCIISGDPHYITFDKRKFIFLGTCTYTLARSCQNMTGPWFSIEGKNEERGMPGATYLRKLYVTIDGVTITLMKNRRILVGQTRIRLPKAVGRAHLAQTGQYVVLTTDFGLLVQYDGNHFVKIVVPGSYTGQMCGLCGDFNGNHADDYRQPDDGMAANDTTFGDSWKTKDDEDERCRSIEPTPCEKDIYDQVISTDQCGLIVDPSGPFRDCIQIVDPKPYFTNCVYDMCQFQGYQPPLCDQLQAYTDACLSAGATVHNWRTTDFCTPPCLPNSHYELCASTCPRTCFHPNVSDCSSKCVEGCDCDPGYVLSDSNCVPLSDCGCTDTQDDYRVINESWYLPKCTEKCTCVSPNKTKCRSASCSDSENCNLLDGIYGCHPKGQETCSASGDPHYRTFDGVFYDFMGNCTYTFAKLCNASSDLPPFSVETSNEHRGSTTRVSYVKAVHIEVYGHRVTLMKNRRVIFNGQRVSTPIIVDGQVEVRVSGGYVSLETDFGLWVRYDGNHHVDVTVPSSYAGQLCGLCGNYNGITSDDNRMADGSATNSFKDLGASWLVPGTDTNCTHDDPPTDCDKDEFKEPRSCGFMKDPKGPFQECNKKIPAEQYFKGCVYDVSCGPNGEMPSLCFALQSYAALCAQAGIPVTWRNKTFCPPNCPAGSHYEPCGNACPASCTDLSAPNHCGRPCVEGCVCDEGRVLSGDTCVAFGECGCVDPERNYHPLGENWMREGNCTERCTCSGPANIICEDWECGPLERCGVLDGILDCHTSGSASCHVAGDPHYYTFDNAMHTFLGTCTYTLVTTCNATMVTPFTISAKNEERGLPYASYLRQVHIDVQGLGITMQKNRRLLLNNQKIRTPFEDDVKGVSVYASGIYNVLETKFGLMVRFDGNHHLEIKLPNTYYGKVCGMCGNFNNNGSDELLMPNGLPAKNAPQLGNSWQVEGDNDPRCASDDRVDLTPPCAPGQERAARARCEELLSAKYRPCRGVVRPTPFIENCVYDLCMYAGMVSALCDNLHSYVEACRSEGVDIKWRNSTFCPMPCQKNSHYTECASACPATCLDVYAPSTCESARPCVEGCDCDRGFVLSDDRCVALGDCGCVDYEGDYHESGDSWLNERCDTKCKCAKGNLHCRKHKCGDNSVCALKKDGKYKCTSVSFETCLISGDPHYLTFDGLVHHFQGKGTYMLTTTFNDSDTLRAFNIKGKNEERYDSSRVSYLSAVYIDVYGHSIKFLEGKIFLLDDEKIKPPYKSREGFNVYQKATTLYLETDIGVSVNFDGRENADIIIPSLYKKKVRGLCGNYDGRHRNDFTLPDGTRVSNLNVFGNSWEVIDEEGDEEDKHDRRRASDTRRYKREAIGEESDPEPETGFLADCSPDQQAEISSTSSCGAILDSQGPFRDCHPHVHPEVYYRNCLFDLCQFYNNSELLCASYGVYAQLCQANGTELPNWRLETGCAMACPPHSSYKSCMDACPPTCANLAAPSECDLPCQEGCECNRGYIYSGLDCVPYSECGCTYRDKYYEVRERFINEDCTEDCKCNMSQTIQCSRMHCPENMTCTIVNSTRTCGKIKPTCSTGSCQNGGTCKGTANGIKCLCRPSYGGQYCENITDVIIVGILVPLLILAIIGAILGYICCCRNGGLKASDRLSDSSSLDSDISMQDWGQKPRTRPGGIANPDYHD